jgi:very-short-patch-repair endonuclease
VASADEVNRAIRQAQFQRLDIGSEGDGDELTRSRLERRFLWLCRRHRLPRPEVNVVVGGCEVDFLWRSHSLVVEVDGWQAHGSRWSFETDRARDLALTAAGYRVVRFTYRQVIERGATVARDLRRLIDA